MDKNLETLVLRHLVKSEPYARQVLPHLRGKYFSEDHRNVYTTICGYVSKYNTFPTADALKIELEQGRPSGIDDSLALIDDVFAGEPHADQKWLIDQTERWCQNQAIGLALAESIDIYQGRVAEKDKGAIPDILQSALAVGFDNSVGLNYTEDIEKRFDAYNAKANKVRFDLDMMNKITKGGFEEKSLNVFMAGPGVGKSLTMCHMAAAALQQGKNVLYITNEMAETKISIRIDANLFDDEIDDIENMSKKEYLSRSHRIISKTNGRLFIKEYPTSSANVNHYRALLEELELKQKFKPDIIFVDYLNIMSSSRLRNLGGSVNSYSMIKSIAEEVRGLAVEYEVPVWSATQFTREGMDSSDPSMTQTSESIGLPATVDLMWALSQPDQFKENGQYLVKQLKNRYKNMDYKEKFVIGVDKPKMQVFDLDVEAQLGIMDSSGSVQKESQDFKFDFNQ